MQQIQLQDIEMLELHRIIGYRLLQNALVHLAEDSFIFLMV